MEKDGWSMIWEALAAVATTAAVIVALYLARRDDIRRKRSEEQVALLSAASIVERLDGTDSVIASLIARIERNRSEIYDPELHARDSLDHIREVLMEPMFKPTTDELVKLIPLQGGGAHRLARAFDIIGSVTDVLARVDAMQMDLRYVHDAIAKSITDLKAARELLQAGSEICKRAAERGAPNLTPEERNGPDVD